MGRALVPLLEARGHKAVSLGRDTTGDIVAFREWPRFLDGLDVVVHLAALAHGAGVDEARLRAVNVDVAAAIGRAASAHGAHMVFLSSVKALGEDSTGRPLGESSPLAPVEAYGPAKADAERALGTNDRLRLVILRPLRVYGPGVKANFLSLIHAVARGWPLSLASIDNRCSFVYLYNLCDAIVRSIESPRALGRTYCVCDGARFHARAVPLARRGARTLGVLVPASGRAARTGAAAQKAHAIVRDLRPRAVARAGLVATVLLRGRFARHGAVVPRHGCAVALTREGA